MTSEKWHETMSTFMRHKFIWRKLLMWYRIIFDVINCFPRCVLVTQSDMNTLCQRNKCFKEKVAKQIATCSKKYNLLLLGLGFRIRIVTSFSLKGRRFVSSRKYWLDSLTYENTDQICYPEKIYARFVISRKYCLHFLTPENIG